MQQTFKLLIKMQMNELPDGRKKRLKPVWCGSVYVFTAYLLSRDHFKPADILQWGHQTYGAFCRQYGTHVTAAVGYHCWNTELLDAMQSDLEGPWFSLENWVSNQRSHLVDVVKAAFEENFECLSGTTLWFSYFPVSSPLCCY